MGQSQLFKRTGSMDFLIDIKIKLSKNCTHHIKSEKVWASSPVKDFLVFCHSNLRAIINIITS